MSKAFNDWWNGDKLSKDNQFAEDTPAYWAWEGWMAGVKAEREERTKLAERLQSPASARFALGGCDKE